MDKHKMTAEVEPSDILWGATAISQAIDRTPRQTFYMLEKGHLPAKKVGSMWCASRSALRKRLTGEAA